MFFIDGSLHTFLVLCLEATAASSIWGIGGGSQPPCMSTYATPCEDPLSASDIAAVSLLQMQATKFRESQREVSGAQGHGAVEQAKASLLQSAESTPVGWPWTSGKIMYFMRYFVFFVAAAIFAGGIFLLYTVAKMHLDPFEPDGGRWLEPVAVRFDATAKAPSKVKKNVEEPAPEPSPAECLLARSITPPTAQEIVAGPANKNTAVAQAQPLHHPVLPGTAAVEKGNRVQIVQHKSINDTPGTFTLGLLMQDDLLVIGIGDSRAAANGWAVGDKVLQVNGTVVYGRRDFQAKVAAAAQAHQTSGTPVTFDVWRPVKK